MITAPTCLSHMVLPASAVLTSSRVVTVCEPFTSSTSESFMAMPSPMVSYKHSPPGPGWQNGGLGPGVAHHLGQGRCRRHALDNVHIPFRVPIDQHRRALGSQVIHQSLVALERGERARL